MYCSRGAEAYKQTDLQTVSKEKLIVLLYQKVLEHLAAASEHAGKDRAEMARRLGLAQRIVAELRGALDHAIGGEVADNLAALYEFAFSEILQMQVDNDPVHVANCRRIIQPLLEAWSTIPPGSAERELLGRRKGGTDAARGETAASSAPDFPQGQQQDSQLLTSA